MNTLCPPIVSVEDVARHFTHEEVVLFDCRFALSDPDAGRRAYAAGHLPGARYADLEKDLSAPASPDAGRHPLPDAQNFARFLAQNGVEKGQLLVAYDQNMAFAARFWWLCRYFGWDKVAVLDGGINAWIAAGLPLETSEPQVLATTPPRLTPRPNLTVTLNELQHLLASEQPLRLIDSRSRERFCGTHEPLDAAAGHIPGAQWKFWQECLDDNGHWQPIDWHRTRWQAFGDTPLVVYCGSGVTACVNLLSLATIGRFKQARLYVGSWSQWAAWHLAHKHPEHKWLARC